MKNSIPEEIKSSNEITRLNKKKKFRLFLKKVCCLGQINFEWKTWIGWKAGRPQKYKNPKILLIQIRCIHVVAWQ